MTTLELKHEQLLRELKTTVESLLLVRSPNVWSINGGLKKTHAILDKIFRHGVKNSLDNFIQGLEWLQPQTSTEQYENDSKWLYKNLENLTLSSKLSWLISDRKHVENCYFPWGFCYNERYVEALVICLKAIERNQLSILWKIDPDLFSLQPNAEETYKIHRRTTSFPEYVKNEDEPKKTSHEVTMTSKITLWNSNPDLTVIKPSKFKSNSPLHKQNIKSSGYKDPNSKPVPNLRPILMDNNIIEYTSLGTSYGSGKDRIEKLTNYSVQSLPEQGTSYLAHSPRSVVDYSLGPMPGEKDYKRQPKRSFIESGGYDVLPMSTGYFPRPTKNQSLMSFLTSSQFARANAELDRENAHFSISEAIISALEQVRCNQDAYLNDDLYDDSDPEIQDLKQRIRVRKREKMAEKKKLIFEMYGEARSDVTNISSRSTITNSSDSSDIFADINIDEASNLSEMRDASMSMASLYSESDLQRNRGVPDGASDVFSAESVAISLIRKFKEKQLPKAADLVWLVSEEEVAQDLLPLPDSWPVNPDDYMPIPLRGTHDWAPPRPQIIFTLHPRPSRKKLMIKQNFRCAGCSVRVVPKYASKYRYCEYLGRYFCTGCHWNQLALIPARILQRWDFSRYPVSTFSYRLLEQMYSDRLFRIFELNKNITKLSKNIDFCQRFSLGLYYLKEFIFACKNAENTQTNLKLNFENRFPSLEELDLYSIDDLVKIQNGTTKKKLKYAVDLCCKHVIDCELCKARGHICEICKSDEVIFPWQLKKVNRCSKCGGCYHRDCWHPDKECIKCKRLSERKESLQNNDSEEET